MAIASAGSIIRVPGSLVWNPTTLSGTPPFGGTYLGEVRNVRFRARPIYRDIWAEELGSVVDSFYCGEGPCELSAVLRYPDSDAVNTTAPKAIASGSSGIHWLFRPGGTTANTKAGTSMVTRAGKLLFVPRAYIDHPMILIYAALPMLDPDLEIPLSWKEEYALGVRFVGSPDTSGRVYDTGLRANLVL